MIELVVSHWMPINLQPGCGFSPLGQAYVESPFDECTAREVMHMSSATIISGAAAAPGQIALNLDPTMSS